MNKIYFLRVMRLFVLFSIVGFMQVSAASFSQTVTLKGTHLAFEEVIRAIRQQTGFEVYMDMDRLKETNPVSVAVSDMPLEEFLNVVLKDQPLSYKMDDKTIFLSRKPFPIVPSSQVESSDRPALAFASLTGQLLSADTKEPIGSVAITVKGSKLGTSLDGFGHFSLSGFPDNAVFVFSSIGFSTLEISYAKLVALPSGGSFSVEESKITKLSTGNFVFYLATQINKLDNVEVMVNTGYQKFPKERATGSFDFINNAQYNRAVGPDALSRLDGISSGVLFNTNKTGNDPTISIRGRSTIFANTQPLIVVDNFPYDGDLNSLNPNDIFNVSILKDAAAASVWGVRAGNGVIVITTKQGKKSQLARVAFNSNITISPKPNLYSIPQLSSVQFIDVEKFAFQNGYYDVSLNYNPYILQSPVVDILSKQRSGLISQSDANQMLDSMSTIDGRVDQSKYTLRSAFLQQYNVSVSGGGDIHQYYLSAGYDNSISSQIPNQSHRVTLDVKNMFQFLRNKLNISTELFWASQKSLGHLASYNPIFPYQKLKNQSGQNLPIYQTWRDSVKNTVGNGELLNWEYIPLNEIKDKDNFTDITDYKLNLSADYKIINELAINLSYQYTKGSIQSETDQDVNSYAVRNLINLFSQINGTDIYRPIPIGNILSTGITNYYSNYGRAQLNFAKTLENHEFHVLAGFEARNYQLNSQSFAQYGYDPSTSTGIPVDYTSIYPTLFSGSGSTISGVPQSSYSTDNTISYYANASYSYKKRYTITASARKDESNLFGVDANKKGIPLWSIGFSWNISEEKYLNKIENFPNIKLRLTNGYNGNLIKTLSAYTTASLSQGNEPNAFGAPYEQITNPPNPSLSWERVNITNAGLDLNTRNGVLSTTLDFYIKKGLDLIGNSTIAPQTGNTQFTGNTSSVLTKGLDLIITTRNIQGKFNWRTTIFLSVVKDKITNNNIKQGANYLYISNNYVNPLEGKPYSAILSYRSAGLDNEGNPQGILDGKVTKDYAAIENSSDPAQLQYIGPSTPTIFGSLLNTISYKKLELSANIAYKGGYYFRRGSYTFNPNSYQLSDYEKRWQQPGDEKKTIVPSIIYPADGNRDIFFQGSSDLIAKGDNIRLKDLQISYSITQKTFESLQIYAYINNINAIIWRANKLNLDPEFVQNGSYLVKTPTSFSLGIKFIM